MNRDSKSVPAKKKRSAAPSSLTSFQFGVLNDAVMKCVAQRKGWIFRTRASEWNLSHTICLPKWCTIANKFFLHFFGAALFFRWESPCVVCRVLGLWQMVVADCKAVSSGSCGPSPATCLICVYLWGTCGSVCLYMLQLVVCPSRTTVIGLKVKCAIFNVKIHVSSRVKQLMGKRT